MQVRDVMTPYAEWIDPQASIADAARMMREHDFGVLPAGGGSRLVRMITDRDMAIRAAAERSIPPRREWRPSWPRAFRNASTTSRRGGRAQHGRAADSALAVVNRDKRLLGIVSIGDLAQRGLAFEAGESLGAIAKH